MCFIHLSSEWILWSSHNKVLSSQIHSNVPIPKACNSVQGSITFFTWVRCMLISVVNEQITLQLLSSEWPMLLPTDLSKFIFIVSITVYQVDIFHSVTLLLTTAGFVVFPCSLQKFQFCHGYQTIYIATLLVSQHIKCWMAGWPVNNYWKRCGRKQLWSNLWQYPGTCLKKLRTITNNLT